VCVCVCVYKSNPRRSLKKFSFQHMIHTYTYMCVCVCRRDERRVPRSRSCNLSKLQLIEVATSISNRYKTIFRSRCTIRGWCGALNCLASAKSTCIRRTWAQGVRAQGRVRRKTAPCLPFPVQIRLEFLRILAQGSSRIPVVFEREKVGRVLFCISRKATPPLPDM
jgi:hypothetical protein